MRRTLVALGLALAVVGAGASSAQPTPRPAGAPPQIPAGNNEIRGSVVDADGGNALAQASVALRRRRDSVLVAGALVTPQGTFRIVGLRPGAYRLRVTALGYAPQTRDLVVSDSTPRVALDPVKMAKVAVTLSAMAVTSERAAVETQADRNAYRAKDVAPAAANATDVLENVPAVQVDADGKVSLRGNENVAVQINGRPSPITGAQLATYLKSLPAAVVDKVEVIPNPSAKYDPEGMAGIINIVLKQNVDLGLSGGAMVSAANADRYTASGNLGYQSGPWTTFTNVGYNADGRTVDGINDRARHTVVGVPLSFTSQDVLGRNGGAGFNVTNTVDRKLSKRDLWSTTVALSRRRSFDETTTSYDEYDAAHTLLDVYDRQKDSDTRGLMYDVNTSLRRTFDPKKKHELSTELRFNRNHDEDLANLWRQGTTGAPLTRADLERDSTDAIQKQFVAQVDYTRTLAPRRTLETGAKSDSRWLDRDYAVLKDATGAGAWARSGISNVLAFDEHVQAAYAVFSQGIRKWDLQGGLRAEYASRDFSLAAQDASYPYHYTSLFPSAVVQYNASQGASYKASYSRRIRRPGTQELNPFPSFFDVQNVFIGNPKLSPEYTDAFELGYTRSGSVGTLQLSPFYRRTTNVIRVDINTADVVDGRDVTTVSFKNMATSTSWGADLNGNARISRKLSGLGGFSAFKVVTDGGSTSVVGSDAVTWMARANLTFNATKTTMLQGAYSYRAPLKIERGRFDAQQQASFVVRQKVRGDKGSVALRVVDPFNTTRFRIVAGDDNLTQITTRRPGVRAAFLTYQMTFGRPPRVRLPKAEETSQGAGFPGN